MIKNSISFILYFLLCLVTCLLFVDKYVVIGVVLSFAIILILYFKYKPKFKNDYILFFLICILLFIFFHFILRNFLSASAISSSEMCIKEAERIIVYIILYLISRMIQITKKQFLFVWKVIFFLSFAIAILQYTKLFDVTSYLKDFYGDSKAFLSTERDSIGSFRCGSFFVNANVYGSFIVAFLGIYNFISNECKELKLMRIFVNICAFLALILTGSRTAFIVGLVVFFVSFYSYIKARKNVVVYFILFILLITFFLLIDTKDFRILKISDGFVESYKIKIDNFNNLFADSNFFNWLIGFGPYDYSMLDGRYLIDFDFGYIIAFYGLIGLFVYAIFIFKTFLLALKNKKNKLINKGGLYVFIICLIGFGISNSIFLNLRMFSIYILMLLIIPSSDETTVIEKKPINRHVQISNKY